MRTGRHAGDWEMVQYRLDGAGRPVEAVYAQHSGAERCDWAVVEQRDGHPVVYSARGSHASYLRAGVRDRTFPDPNDEADGRGTVVRPRVVRVTADSPRWMRWSGRWGGARARWWIPGEQDSPFGPAHQPQGRWADPTPGPPRHARAARPAMRSVNATGARTCSAAAPGRAWPGSSASCGGVDAGHAASQILWVADGRRGGRGYRQGRARRQCARWRRMTRTSPALRHRARRDASRGAWRASRPAGRGPPESRS
ncbi:MAG: Vps62-related protein [Actinobacteria bacterium]|nr:Vps62-related protein [Actinomycetota bacterium]